MKFVITYNEKHTAYETPFHIEGTCFDIIQLGKRIVESAEKLSFGGEHGGFMCALIVEDEEEIARAAAQMKREYEDSILAQAEAIREKRIPRC